MYHRIEAPRLIVHLALVAALVATSASWAQAAVSFDIGPNGATGNRWLTGSGYGVDDNEGSATLLAVTFAVDSALDANVFSLNVGGSNTFTFGSMTFSETNSMGGITAAETDGLDVTAFLTFVLPPVGDVSNPGIVAAVQGSVSDAAADLTFTFAPVLVNFGVGGQFRVDLSDVTFTRTGTLSVTATVELLKESSPTGGGLEGAPEPATFVIWSLLGVIGAVYARRRMA